MNQKNAEKIINSSIWSVKGVKFMTGHDCDSMECSLYKDRKRVATVWDDSWGGDFQYTWIKEDLSEEFENFAKSLGEVEHNEYSDSITYDGDCVVDVLVNTFEENKRLKKLCKKETLFLLPEDNKEEGYRTINHTFDDPRVKEYIIRKYGENVEIINERF
jgi:hypothetical protein